MEPYQVTKSLNSSPEEIIFTSGATEANDLAIKGVAEAYFAKGRHLVTVVTEHRAVLDLCHYLEKLGFEVTILAVGADGLIDLQLLEKSLRPDTILLSIMAANNEIGVIQPLAAIGAICREYQVLFHTDAAQAIGKIPLDVEEMNIDLMSLTAHKVHGPKGIGALYVRRRNPRVRLAAQIQGGGQEKGLRSGTIFTPQIVGFAKAVELGIKAIEEDTSHLNQLKARLWQIISQLDRIYLNGHPSQRLAGNLNISIEGVDGAALLLGLQPIVALSSGSACSSSHTAPSHVLTALGRPESLAYASLRFGLSRFNTLEEIELVGEQVVLTVNSLRKAKNF